MGRGGHEENEGATHFVHEKKRGAPILYMEKEGGINFVQRIISTKFRKDPVSLIFSLII